MNAIRSFIYGLYVMRGFFVGLFTFLSVATLFSIGANHFLQSAPWPDVEIIIACCVFPAVSFVVFVHGVGSEELSRRSSW